MVSMRVVKKYKSNRKYYDIETKSYTTLTVITTWFKQDIEFRVTEYETNKDLTEETILRALLEQNLLKLDKDKKVTII